MQGKKIDYYCDFYINEIKERLMNNFFYSDNGCWIWNKCLNQNNYGVIRARGKNYLAHRLSFEIFKKENPKNKFVCHKCDNPLCINPEHLFLGTQKDNLKDAKNKNRMINGESHYRSKLKINDILEIKKMCKSGITQKLISKKFNVSESNISKINSNKTWKRYV